VVSQKAENPFLTLKWGSKQTEELGQKTYPKLLFHYWFFHENHLFLAGSFIRTARSLKILKYLVREGVLIFKTLENQNKSFSNSEIFPKLHVLKFSTIKKTQNRGY
jgi:hypothetical protein